MRKVIVVSFFLCFFFSLFSQKEEEENWVRYYPVKATTYFSWKEIQGVIFPDTFYVHTFNKRYPKRFTPSVSEVLCVDSLAFRYVERKNKKGLKQQNSENCPIIHENRNNYYRQVAGYIDPKSGDEIIYINYFWKELAKDKFHNTWLEEWLVVWGGCSKYWLIEYNRRKKKIVNFSIN